MILLYLFSAGIWLAERLSSAVIYGIATILGRAIATLPTAQRHRLRRNLAVVVDTSVDDPQLDPLVKQVFRTQAANYADLLRARCITPSEVEARLIQSGEGWEPFMECVRRKTGCVLVTPHFGRVELLNHFLGARHLPITLPVERLQPPALFELITRQRTRPTYELVPHDAALRPSLRALKRGEVVVFFAEWAPGGNRVNVQFFGRSTPFPPGPAFVALRADVPLFVGFELPSVHPGTFLAHIGAPLQVERSSDSNIDVQRLTQRMASEFERGIRQAPGHWVMFHDIWPENQPVQQPSLEAAIPS
ncbi:MAG TPA: hypothetical protein VGW38_08020 [Chloroflexota bacterium]|nr:hypothetical protein [Chloroflexota bacterium]